MIYPQMSDNRQVREISADSSKGDDFLPSHSPIHLLSIHPSRLPALRSLLSPAASQEISREPEAFHALPER